MLIKKTNATRLLDKLNIDYQIVTYQVNPADLSAEHVSREVGVPIKQVFKTLVSLGDKTGELVACIPGDSELNLKAFATLSGNKKVHLIPVKEINKQPDIFEGAFLHWD